jgi:hypothetical protein
VKPAHRRLRSATPCRGRSAIRLHSAMGIKVGLTLVSLTLLAGCRGPQTGTVVDLPARDLTLPTPAASRVQFTSSAELARTSPSSHPVRAPQPRPKHRSTVKPTTTVVREDVPPPPPAPRTESARPDTARVTATPSGLTGVLEPGETVTVLPATAPTTGTPEPTELPPSKGRQAAVWVGRGGGNCHPGRGSSPGFR